MKISTKGRYGTRFMVELALRYGEAPIPLKEIAQSQEVSDKYLEQIVPQLSRAGFINSVRGSQGGYSLAHHPSKITIGEILRALEGSLAPVECLDCEDCETICDNLSACATREVWEKIYEAVNNVVDNITLESLARRSQELKENYDYVI